MKSPRSIDAFGVPCTPIREGETWLESESVQTDYGQFRRRGLVRHPSGRLVNVRADIPDTYFTTPATTEGEIGYITFKNMELTFVPYEKQNQTPAEYRKSIKKAYA